MPDTAQGSNATVALRLAEAFRRHGVTLTFGQSLPSAFHLACPHVGIDQKVYRQENAGGAMADGYARISRKVGVVTAQNGPAATLLIAPLAEALKASVPIVALVQEVTRDAMDRNAFQDLDHLNLFAPVAKWVRRLERADRLDDFVDMAFTAAASGRPGPAGRRPQDTLPVRHAPGMRRPRSRPTPVEGEGCCLAGCGLCESRRADCRCRRRRWRRPGLRACYGAGATGSQPRHTSS